MVVNISDIADKLKTINMKEIYSNVKNALEKESEPDPDTSQTEYNVEKIIAQKEETVNGKRKRMFLVKWEGYAQSESTWEPEENLYESSSIHLTNALLKTAMQERIIFQRMESNWNPKKFELNDAIDQATNAYSLKIMEKQLKQEMHRLNSQMEKAKPSTKPIEPLSDSDDSISAPPDLDEMIEHNCQDQQSQIMSPNRPTSVLDQLESDDEAESVKICEPRESNNEDIICISSDSELELDNQDGNYQTLSSKPDKHDRVQATKPKLPGPKPKIKKSKKMSVESKSSNERLVKANSQKESAKKKHKVAPATPLREAPEEDFSNIFGTPLNIIQTPKSTKSKKEKSAINKITEPKQIEATPRDARKKKSKKRSRNESSTSKNDSGVQHGIGLLGTTVLPTTPIQKKAKTNSYEELKNQFYGQNESVSTLMNHYYDDDLLDDF